MKKTVISIIILAFATPSVALWLFESHLQYMLYFFEVTLILTMCSYVLRTPNKKFKIKISVGSRLDYLFLGASLTLLALNLFEADNLLSLFIAMVVSFFLPGYILLRVVGFCSLDTWLEWPVMAFILSMGTTSLIFTFALRFASHRSVLLSSIYVVLSLFPLLKDQVHKHRKRVQIHKGSQMKEFCLSDALPLLWVFLFFVLTISTLYPQTVYLPAEDIVRHFSSMRSILILTGYQSYYPWFHLSWAATYELSTPSMEAFQTGLAYLSIMAVFSFFIMAKGYLSNHDRRIPILSTIFFSVFSGFGWLHFMREKFITPDPSMHLDTLKVAYDVSWCDISRGPGPWIWLWFRPLTVGITGLFVLLYLLKRTDIGKKSFFVLSYFTAVSLGMLHFSELVFYTILLFILSVFHTPTAQIRLRDSLSALLLALVTIPSLSVLYNLVGVGIKISSVETILLIILSALSVVAFEIKKHRSISTLHALKTNTTKYVRYAILCLCALWTALLLHWFANAKSFHVWMVSSLNAVPWMLYPVLFGICGLLTFPAISYIIKRYSDQVLREAAMTFALSFIMGIILGRLLTCINLHWFYSTYSERRIIPLTFSASAILASISVQYIIKRIQSKHVLSALLLSLLVVGGFTSTGLSIEYWVLHTQENMLSPAERTDVALLNNLDPMHYLLPFSQHELKVAEFAPFAWRIGHFREHIWTAKSPELVLNALFSTGHPAVIYTTEDDHTKLLEPPYVEGYIMRHLLNVLPSVSHDSTQAPIYQMKAIAPPTENSRVVLVMPENYSAQNSRYAYDIMSSAGYNYTVAYIFDVRTLAKAEVVVAPSEILASEILNQMNDLQLNFGKMIILNLDGYYGEFAETEYPNYDSYARTFSLSGVSQNKVNLTYLNLYPLISAIEDGSNEAYRSLGNITRLELGNLSSYTYQEEPINSGSTAAFREATLQGNITISFDSIIIQAEDNSNSKVTIDEKVTRKLEENEKICPINFRKAVVRTQFVELVPGLGFYIKAFLRNATLTIYGEQMNLVSSLYNYSILPLASGMASVKMENITLLLRRPLISVDGRSSFTDIYAYHELHQSIRAFGNDCEICGYCSIRGTYGDTYSIAKRFEMVGNVKLSKPLYGYNEWQSFVGMLPYLALLALSYAMFKIKRLLKRINKLEARLYASSHMGN